MEKHGGKNDVDATVLIGQDLAGGLTEMNRDGKRFCSSVTILQARGRNIQPMHVSIGEGLFPGQRVVADRTPHIDNQLWSELWLLQARVVGHRVSNIVQIFSHHAKGEDFEPVVVNSACFGTLVVAGHQMNIHGIDVIR